MTLIMALSLFSTLAIGMMPAYLSAKPQKLPSDGRSCSAEKETGLAILSTILGALLPMVVSILLGFVAAWRHDFGSKDASTLNRMVLQYAVPLTLFTGTVMTSRKAFSQDLPLVITLCVGITGFYCVVFLFSRLVLHMQVSSSALSALTASAPAVPFARAVKTRMFHAKIALYRMPLLQSAGSSNCASQAE